MIYLRYWLKLGTAALVATAAGTALVLFTRPPRLTSVAVLTETVPAMQAIPPQAVHWTRVASPPPDAVTPNVSWGALVASQALPPGTILTTGDFAAPQANGLHPGEVQWLVPVSAASSGLAAIGQRVDVWNNQGGTFQVVAYGVRVIGLYSSSGTPLSTASSAGSGPGMVALAVPSTAMGTLLDVTSPYLVVDPNQAGFRLAAPPVVSSATSAASTTPSSSSAAATASRPQSATPSSAAHSTGSKPQRTSVPQPAGHSG